MAAPPSSFSPLSGQQSGLTIGAYTADADVDWQDVSTPPTKTALPGLYKWNLDITVQGSKFTGVGAPIDSWGVLWTMAMKGGIGTWTVNIDTVVDANNAAGAATLLRLVSGSFVLFDLVFNTLMPYGYASCVGKVMKVTPSADKNNTSTPSMVSVTIEGHGALPVPGVIS